jgi:hypothetical protein
MAYTQAHAITLVLGNVIGPIVGSSNPGGPGNFQTCQLISPWGQTQACLTWEEMKNQLWYRYAGVDTGRLGNFLDLGLINGPTPTPFNQTFANVTATVTSAIITGIANTSGITPGMLAFLSVAGLVGLAYVISVQANVGVTLNQNFGGTTGSTYTLTLVPCPAALANDIVSNP